MMVRIWANRGSKYNPVTNSLFLYYMIGGENMKKLNLVGKKYGRLTVIEQGTVKNGRTYSICKCECGNIVEVMNKMLRNGHVLSCGCLKKENISELGKRTGNINIIQAQEKAHTSNIIHGESKTRLYKIWQAMLQRCENKNSTHWRYYGGKGIMVCQEWHSFQNFRNWSLNNGYEDNLTIDRINSSKDYCPNNCRWITQSFNSSRAGECDKRYWAINLNEGHYIEFNNLAKFLRDSKCEITYSRAQDMIRHKSLLPYNGWIIGK